MICCLILLLPRAATIVKTDLPRRFYSFECTHGALNLSGIVLSIVNIATSIFLTSFFIASFPVGNLINFCLSIVLVASEIRELRSTSPGLEAFFEEIRRERFTCLIPSCIPIIQ